MRFCLTILLVMGLSGCAWLFGSRVQWMFPPGGTQAQWNRDKYECKKEAQQPSSSAYVGAYGGSGHSGYKTNYSLAADCLRARGYREVKN